MTTPPHRPSPLDRMRQAIQSILDEEDGGWTLGPFVVAMGIERLQSDGSVESLAWYWTPQSQAEWMTGGLLEAAIEMRAAADIED